MCFPLSKKAAWCANQTYLPAETRVLCGPWAGGPEHHSRPAALVQWHWAPAPGGGVPRRWLG